MEALNLGLIVAQTLWWHPFQGSHILPNGEAQFEKAEAVFGHRWDWAVAGSRSILPKLGSTPGVGKGNAKRSSGSLA